MPAGAKVVSLAVGALVFALVGAYNVFKHLNGSDPLALREFLGSYELPFLGGTIEKFTIEIGVTPGTSGMFLIMLHVVYILALCAVFYRQRVVQITATMRNDALVAAKLKEKVRQIPSASFVAWWMWGHNLFMSVFSLAMLFGLVYGGIIDGRFASYDTMVCNPPGEEKSLRSTGLVAFSMFVFYLSKVTEFADTFIIVLRNKPVIWLHKVHHLTTMSLVWHCMRYPHLPACLLCAALNCFVHVIMYFWFANPLNFKKGLMNISTLLYNVCKEWITLSQILQFVIVLVSMFWVVGRRYEIFPGGACNGTFACELHGIGLYAVYLLMFGAFFVSSYCKPEPKEKDTGEHRARLLASPAQ